MAEPEFLSSERVVEIHSDQIALFGGAAGMVEEGLLESAVAQPVNLYLYEEGADIFDCAAAYAYHICKNHPFVDGNKRTALASALS